MVNNKFYKDIGLQEVLEDNVFSLITKYKNIFLLRYVDGLNFRAIGSKVKLSHERVRQICKNIIFELKTPKNIVFITGKKFDKDTIDYLNINKRTYNGLKKAKINQIEQAMELYSSYVDLPYGLGEKSRENLRKALIEWEEVCNGIK